MATSNADRRLRRSEAEDYALERLIGALEDVKRRDDQQLDNQAEMEKAVKWAAIRNGLRQFSAGYG